jgi:glycosyltransferase involved in cell wall biosynthesis
MSRASERSVSEHSLSVVLIAPPWLPVPPKGYGGIEAVVASLARQLSARGHRVTLVASGDSHVDGVEIVAPFDRAQRDVWEDFHIEMIHVLEGVADLRADVFHDHSLMGALAWSGIKHPLVHTMHGPATGKMGRLYRALAKSVPMIAISRQQAADLGTGVIDVIYNCVDVERFRPAEEKADYVAFLGRICYDKGPDDAIRAARKAGIPIKLAGKIANAEEQEFFSNVIQDMLGDDAEYLGEIPEDYKPQFLAEARALLVPIRWPEPFGLVMAEAQACSTPVIAYPNGAAPELIEDGVTGFLVDSVDEMAEKIAMTDSIDPADCRRRAVTVFGPERMGEETERLYIRLLERPPVAVAAR